MDIVGRSDVGRVRAGNEDEIAFDAAAGIAILADGMGGLEHGELASRAATEVVMTALQGLPESERAEEERLRSAISAANSKVLSLARRQGAGAMGTTMVVWLDVGAGQCFIAHVGDSRAYRLREGQLQALTEDHSVVQQLINEGVLSQAEARVSVQRNVITRAIGLDAKLEVELRSWVRGRGDVFLLCSDGLTDMLADQEIEALLNEHLSTSGDGDLDALSQRLIDAANEAGGKDNVSVVLVRAD